LVEKVIIYFPHPVVMHLLVEKVVISFPHPIGMRLSALSRTQTIYARDQAADRNTLVFVLLSPRDAENISFSKKRENLFKITH
jgi:hypothetical protein